jgi:hypothetical protein
MPVTEKEAKAFLGKLSAGQQIGVAMKQHQQLQTMMKRWLNFLCHCRTSQQQSFHNRNFVTSLQYVILCAGFNGLRSRAYLK